MRLFICFSFLLITLNAKAQSGITWSQSASVAPSQYGNMHPRVVTDRLGNPLIIWGKSDSKQVYFSRWTGNGFSAPANLNPPSIPVFAASWAGPDIAAHGDTVYVVFKETPEDASGIYIVSSFDGGANFSLPVRVDAIADSISRFPAVGTDAIGNPLVAFMKFNPGWGNPRYAVAKSEDFGSTFNPDVPGSGFSGGVVCDCCPASLVTADSTTVVLYRDNLNNLRNSWAGVSFDAGNTFSAGIEIDNTDWTISACPSSGPDGVIFGDKLYSVFMSGASGKTLCYRSRSTLSGLEMELTEPLTGVFPGLGVQNFPRIATTANVGVIVWSQSVNGNAQLALQFTDNLSAGFGSSYAVLVDDDVENADVVFSADDKLYVVWEDRNSGTVKYKSGTYISSSQSGPSSTSPSIRLYPNPVTNANLYLAFETEENSPVSFQILNAQGQILLAGNGETNSGNLKVNTAGLPKGLYYIRLHTCNEFMLRQFVIE